MRNLRYCKKHHLDAFSENYMLLKTYIDEPVSEDEVDKLIDQFLEDFDRYCEDYIPAIKQSVLRYCFRNNTYYCYNDILNDNGTITNGTDYGGLCLSFHQNNCLTLGYAASSMVINDDTKDFHLEKIKEYTGYNVECIKFGDAYNE